MQGIQFSSSTAELLTASQETIPAESPSTATAATETPNVGRIAIEVYDTTHSAVSTVHGGEPFVTEIRDRAHSLTVTEISSRTVEQPLTLAELCSKINTAQKRVWGILVPLASIAAIISVVCVIRLFDWQNLDKDIAVMQGAFALFSGMIAIKNGLEARTTWKKVKTLRRKASSTTV